MSEQSPAFSYPMWTVLNPDDGLADPKYPNWVTCPHPEVPGQLLMIFADLPLAIGFAAQNGWSGDFTQAIRTSAELRAILVDAQNHGIKNVFASHATGNNVYPIAGVLAVL